MRYVTPLALAVALSCAPAYFASAQSNEEVQFRTTKVAGNVSLLQGRGGNIAVSSGPDGLLVVDDDYANLSDKLLAALSAFGGAPKFVLNTHWHGDHTGGNAALGRDASIVAHTNVRKRLGSEQRVMGNVIPASPKVALPIITFDESLSVHFNGEEIRATHLGPGHTDGDIVVHFTGSNVLHMGDLFFKDRFPFVDLGSGGDVEGYLLNVSAVLERAPNDVKIIPGHGDLSTPDDLRRYRDMLVETIGVVRERMRAGKTLEQIKAEGLPEKWAAWGDGFIKTDRWLETIHTSLSKQKGAAAASAER